MEYYSAINKEWNTDPYYNMMNFENMLYERSQTKKSCIEWFHLYAIFIISKSTEGGYLVVRKRGMGEGGMSANGYEVSFKSDENNLKLLITDVCTTLWIY